jgi:hypothetical protein
MKPTRYVFCQDQDSHWYMVPETRARDFREVCANAYANDDFEAFSESFEHFRCDSPFAYSFAEPERMES